jgi:putative transposase
MKVMKGYKTELDLNNAQRTLCLKACGTARFTYNWGLRRYQEEYEAGRKTPTSFSLQKEINVLKKTAYPWMYEVSKCVTQGALDDLQHAFKKFFDNCKKKKFGKIKGKSGYPKPKSKKKGIGSFYLTGSIHVHEKHIQLPRLGLLRLKRANYIPASGMKILSARVSEKAGRWYVSVQVEEEGEAPEPATGKVLGVDLGIKTLATTSEAKAFENPKALRKNVKKLARLGCRHSRKKKGSENRKKAARKLARMHARIAHIRENALHQVTSAIAKTKPCTIILEDLNVKGMMKNRKLSRAVGDVGMGEFKRQMLYKAEKYGSTTNFVSRWFPSSKTCSCCGWVDEDQDLNDRVFVCEDCGYVADRDYNAAKSLAQTEQSSDVFTIVE